MPAAGALQSEAQYTRVAMSTRSGKDDVVITGMGVVSPIGTGLDSYREALRAGTSGIDSISLFDASRMPTTFAGEVSGFDPERLLAGAEVLQQTRERRVLLACSAARMAVQDAGFDGTLPAEARCGVVLGAGIHPAIPDMAVLHDSGVYPAMFDDGDLRPEKFSGAIARETSGENRHYPIANRANGGVLAVARQHGASGVCYTVMSACAAATQAIGLSCRLLHSGTADIVITGGYDSMVFNFGVYAFCLLGLMSTRNDRPRTAVKPFDKNRDGFALGEGAGVLILERREHAEHRRSRIYARAAGYGSSVDAYKVTDPHPDGTGAVLAMRSALNDAGVQPGDIDYINAHGTATAKNDRIESTAIKDVFGRHAERIPVSSTKSMIGHLMAAGGALELIATVLGMEAGFVPPTINYETPDADCDLDYVPNVAREMQIDCALSNSFGLGGQNASILVMRDA